MWVYDSEQKTIVNSPTYDYYCEWIKSGGSTHWENVDEYPLLNEFDYTYTPGFPNYGANIREFFFYGGPPNYYSAGLHLYVDPAFNYAFDSVTLSAHVRVNVWYYVKKVYLVMESFGSVWATQRIYPDPMVDPPLFEFSKTWTLNPFSGAAWTWNDLNGVPTTYAVRCAGVHAEGYDEVGSFDLWRTCVSLSYRDKYWVSSPISIL